MQQSNTTRYLCAAAHLDSSFRTQVLENILDEEYRAISIAAGVDLIAVIKHCLNAERRKLIRNIVISILFLIAWSTSLYGQIDSELDNDPFLSLFLK